MELEAMRWVNWGTAGLRVAVIALALVIWFQTQRWLGALAVVLALGEAWIVLVLRAHYTLDVVAGAFAAWFAADVAAWVAPWVDGWLKF